MPGSNNSNGIKWTIGILVTICLIAVGTIGSLSIAGDGNLAAADLKLDDEKLDKAVFKAHEKTQEKDEQRTWELLQVIDKKLNEALKK